jgi:predicted  nucleic acid-binding Zn-ribbon protein
MSSYVQSKLPEGNWGRLRKLKKEIEIYEKNRKEIADSLLNLYVKSEKVNKSLKNSGTNLESFTPGL